MRHIRLALRALSFLAAPFSAWIDSLFFGLLVCSVLGAIVDFTWKQLLGFELHLVQEANGGALGILWLIISLAVLAQRRRMGAERWARTFTLKAFDSEEKESNGSEKKK